jgi:ankyrin repeat protein
LGKNCRRKNRRRIVEIFGECRPRNYNLWTPLDCAAAFGRPKCARMLLEAGAPVDPVDKVMRGR